MCDTRFYIRRLWKEILWQIRENWGAILVAVVIAIAVCRPGRLPLVLLIPAVPLLVNRITVQGRRGGGGVGETGVE